MLNRGDMMPHIEVRTVAGALFRYASIWQQRNLVLVALAGTGSAAGYAAEIEARAAEFDAHDGVIVITSDRVPGLPPRAVVIADRWGEIVHVARAADASSLPAAQDLLDWIEHLQHRCPECEGEAR